MVYVQELPNWAAKVAAASTLSGVCLLNHKKLAELTVLYQQNVYLESCYSAVHFQICVLHKCIWPVHSRLYPSVLQTRLIFSKSSCKSGCSSYLFSLSAAGKNTKRSWVRSGASQATVPTISLPPILQQIFWQKKIVYIWLWGVSILWNDSEDLVLMNLSTFSYLYLCNHHFSPRKLYYTTNSIFLLALLYIEARMNFLKLKSGDKTLLQFPITLGIKTNHFDGSQCSRGLAPSSSASSCVSFSHRPACRSLPLPHTEPGPHFPPLCPEFAVVPCSSFSSCWLIP